MLRSALRNKLAEYRGEAPQRLTAREREIVHSFALGMRNGEVGQTRFISEQTVKTHLSHIFRKLHVREHVELTLYAVRAGIVGTDERRS